jgi:hypothetical protein
MGIDDVKIKIADAYQAQLIRRSMELQDFHLRPFHAEHDKNTVCLTCFNMRLQRAGWTYKFGERAVVVNRYAGGKGRMTRAGMPGSKVRTR